MKLKYVRQKDDYGCAVACMSMVTGIAYDRIASRFQNDFKKEGIHADHTRNFVCEHGFSAVEVIAHGYVDVGETNKRVSRPFAEVHIVTVQPFADSLLNHAVVMDRRGRVFDPDRPDKKDLAEYYSVVRVIGFFNDRKKKR